MSEALYVVMNHSFSTHELCERSLTNLVSSLPWLIVFGLGLLDLISSQPSLPSSLYRTSRTRPLIVLLGILQRDEVSCSEHDNELLLWLPRRIL